MTSPTSGQSRADHHDHAAGRRANEDAMEDLLRAHLNSSPAAAAETTGDGIVPGHGPAASGGKSPYVKSTGRPPSPPWAGAIIIGLLFTMAAIVLTYTLLDWQWQQNLGWWNYVAVIGLIPFVSVFMRRWQPDDTL